ncbi:MAG: hypothetical protein JXR13_20150 [Thalassovita sp.]
MRRTKRGSVQSAVQKSYTLAGGLEAVQEATGVALSTLSYGTELREDRPGGIGINYMDRLARMDPKSAEPIARHFALLSGGHFQSGDERVAGLSALQHASKVIRESGEGAAALMAFAEGGDRHEAIKELQDVADAVLAAIQDIKAEGREE